MTKHKNKKPSPQSIHPPRPASSNDDPEKVGTRVVTQRKVESYSGPIPHPMVLEHYEKVLPGSTDRIISMAENQSQHRHHMEKHLLSMESRNSLLGLIFGFTIGMTSVLGGIACIMSGHTAGGSIVGGVGLTSLVGVFVYGSRERRKEREVVAEMRKNSSEQLPGLVKD